MEKCVIFSGGPHEPSQLSRQVVEKAVKDGTTIYAADSGADHAVNLYGLFPKIVFGDRDSIDEITRCILEDRGTLFNCSGATLKSIPRNQVGPLSLSQKDQTDTQLAIDYAVLGGARRVIVIGGTSDKSLSHTLGNIKLAVLNAQRHPEIDIEFISGNQRIWARRGPREEIIHGKAGDVLNLFAERTKVRGIRTTNLRYPLDNEDLEYGVRGISNEFLKNVVEVSFRRGVLLFIHEQAE